MVWMASSVKLISSGQQPVFLQLARDQVIPGDLHLLVFGVAGDADHFHAVEQRAGMVSNWFAVVINITCERLTGTSR